MIKDYRKSMMKYNKWKKRKKNCKNKLNLYQNASKLTKKDINLVWKK